MKYKEDNPDNLDRLGDMLPADVLKILNELPERMHQSDHTNQGSKIEVVYVAAGGQHVDIIENQNIYGDQRAEQQKNRKTAKRNKPASETPFADSTPLSALFRENHHDKLKTVIESWRPYLINDEKSTEALSLTHFEFDKDQIYSNKVYRDLCELDALGALQVSLSQLARYLAEHSNLSQSYATLYQQLKDYRAEHMTFST